MGGLENGMMLHHTSPRREVEEGDSPMFFSTQPHGRLYIKAIPSLTHILLKCWVVDGRIVCAWLNSRWADYPLTDEDKG